MDAPPFQESGARLIETPSKSDSIKITLKFFRHGRTGINVSGNLGHEFLEFRNNTEQEAIYNKSIPRVSDTEQILFLSLKFINGFVQHKSRHFLVGKDVSELSFEFKNGDLQLMNMETNVELDQLINDYYNGAVGNEIVKLKKENLDKEKRKYLLKKIDSTYAHYKQRFTLRKDTVLNEMNELIYIAQLQNIYPFDSRIDQYLKKDKPIIIDGPTIELTYFFYVENHITTLDFESLNSGNFSNQYLSFISKGVYKYLTKPENRMSPYFYTSWQWLKTTVLYQNQKREIDKNIAKVRGRELSEALKKLTVLDEAFNDYSMENVVSRTPSDYYLIDLWATWCGPCIKGFKEIEKLQLPKNLTVINLSVDKLVERGKWKSKSYEFRLENSYLIDETQDRKILETLNMETLPRYIVMDKNFQILNVDFFQPHEPKFLEYLKELTNSN